MAYNISMRIMGGVKTKKSLTQTKMSLRHWAIQLPTTYHTSSRGIFLSAYLHQPSESCAHVKWERREVTKETKRDSNKHVTSGRRR